MIGSPERFGVRDAERGEGVQDAGGLAVEVGAQLVAAPLVHVEARRARSPATRPATGPSRGTAAPRP